MSHPMPLPVAVRECFPHGGAKFFMETAEKQGWTGLDEATMIGWFANAMMAMHDHIKRQAPVVLPDGSAFFVSEVSGEFHGKTPEKWSERLDSNQRPLSPQETDGG